MTVFYIGNSIEIKSGVVCKGDYEKKDWTFCNDYIDDISDWSGGDAAVS